jgi:hypothetical protein
VIVVGLFTALLVIVTAPVRAPPVVGENVTLIVHVAFTARLVPQVFVCAKSPLAAIELIVADAVPLFVTVTDCAAVVLPTTVLANERLVGFAESDGPGSVPVPVKATGFARPAIVMVSVPLRVPVAVGENVTLIVQLAFTARLEPQLFVCA